MDFSDPTFETWLVQQEAEADRVNRRRDYRQRQASELLRNINQVRILLTRATNSGTEVDSAELEALVSKIRELSSKITK
jgi:hypothetical protein